MEKKIVFTPVEPNKNLLWLHYKNGLLVLQRFGSKGWEDITNSDQITEAEVRELIKDKANLVGGKVPAEELPSYVDDVIEFNNIQVADAEISSIIGNNLYKNQIRFINNSTTLPDRIGSEDKYPDMFVNFGENTSEDDWTTFEPEQGKIYINTTNNYSYRWSGSQLIDLDKSWSNDIKDLQENTVRTDFQDLSVVQQKQAFENLGMKVYVTDSTFLGSTLTAEEIEQLTVSKALLFTDTGELFLFGAASSSQIYFYKFINRYSIGYITLNKLSGSVSNGSFDYQDVNALHFTAQNPALTASQKDTALSNIGLDFVIVDYSELSTTLSDDKLSQLVNAKGLILTNTPDDYTRAVVFTAGTRLVNSIVFSSVEDAKNINYIILNIPNKVLSLVQTSKLIIGNFNQNLTNTEKDTVLSNIGLNFVHVDYSLLGTTLTDERFAALDNAKGIILVGTPSNYSNPTVFIKGNNISTACYFVSHNTGTTYCQIKLDKSTKILSNINANLTYVGTVRYIEEQSLTDTQKQQARTNIGVKSADELLEDADFIAQLKTKLETV